jgi:hypothetical protein
MELLLETNSATSPLPPYAFMELSLTDENFALFFTYLIDMNDRLCGLVVQWSEFLTTDPEVRIRFPALPEKKVVGLERGPLSLVSTTEELLDRKVAAPV